jgi:Na+/serine symporter
MAWLCSTSWLNGTPRWAHTTFSLSIHQSMDTKTDSVFLAIVNSVALNMDVQVSLLYDALHSFGRMSRSGVAGSYGSSTSGFLRNLHTDCHSGYTNLQSHQQCMRVLFSLGSLLAFVFLKVVIVTGVRWNSVLLICISIIGKGIEQFFTYLFSICTSFEN